MGFFLQGWGRVDTSIPNPIYVLQAIEASPPQVPVRIPPRTIGCFRTYNYYADDLATTFDTQTDIAEDGYFDLVRGDLQAGDIIFAYSADARSTVTYVVTAINTQAPYVITDAFNLGPAEVVTADFANGAVTYAKIQDVSPLRLLGNPTGGAIAPEEIDLGSGLVFSAGSLNVRPNLLIHESGTITAAEWKDMYNTPINLTIDAPGALIIVIDRVELRQIYGGAQYTGGGTVIIGYGDFPNGDSEPATSNNISAATINNIAATSTITRIGFTTTPIFVANAIGVGIWISNDTAVFATGTGNWEYNIWYRII